MSKTASYGRGLGHGDEPIEAENSETRLSAIYRLQPDLLDLLLHQGPQDPELDTILEKIRQTFDADGCIVVLGGRSPKESKGSDLPFYSGCGVSDAFAYAFVADESLAGEQGPLPGTDATESEVCNWYWCERFGDFENNGACGRIILVFKTKRAASVEERLALRSLGPLIGLFAGSAGRDKALKSANDRFTSLAASIPGVVYQRVVKPDGDIRYTYISESAEDLFGVSAHEILTNPKALFDCFTPEYKDTFRQKLLEASRTLSIWDVEASIVTPDGKKKYTHAIARPKRQEDGSVLWTGVILNASRIKQAELESAATEARTRKAIIESLSQGFLLFDENDKLVLKNSHFLRLYPTLGDVVFEGADYVDLVRAELQSGLDSAKSTQLLEARVRERLELHADKSHAVIERHLSEDCWIQINEHRTPEGGTVVLYTDVSEIKQREAHIHHMAHHDALTGLPNRLLFRSQVDQALAQAHRYDTSIAVLLLDLDHFKNINDTLGHPAGDKLLCVSAQRIRSEIREMDTVARLGGDEFAIVMPDFEDADTISSVARRLLEVLEKPIDIDGQQAVSSVSIGIAVSSETRAVTNVDSVEADALIKHADLALYRAKADGRNTFRFFEREMDELARARRMLEVDLRSTLDNKKLDLHFQPLININTNEIAGFEALARWDHPDQGLIPTEDFIRVAEETGLIVPLGKWVLRRACEVAATWPKTIKVAVNLSFVQFKSPDLVEFIAQTLSDTGFEAERLELEITETVLLRNTEDTMEKLYRLKGLGVRIAMDDFGTGYSSLGNLRKFPFDKIKIDRSFVSELENNSEAAAIVKAVVGLGRSLGIETTAEGVESREQLAYLRLEGCTEVQGFYYSKAKPANKIEKLLKYGVKGMEERARNRKDEPGQSPARKLGPLYPFANRD